MKARWCETNGLLLCIGFSNSSCFAGSTYVKTESSSYSMDFEGVNLTHALNELALSVGEFCPDSLQNPVRLMIKSF